MGLSNKVILVLVILSIQVTYRLCKPSKLKSPALKNFKDSKLFQNNPTSTPFSSTNINKLQQQTKLAKAQNARINQFKTKETVYKTYNFPETEYPLDNTPRDPFYGMNYKGNYQVNNLQRRNSLSENAAINNLKKEMKMKRRLSSNKQLYTDNAQAGRQISSAITNFASSPDSIYMLNSGTFPEVQYPLNAMETWAPTFWNQYEFKQEDQRFNSYGPSTFKSNIDNFQQPFTKLTKAKASQFLKPYDKLKEEKQNAATKNSKRSGMGDKGSTFNKTETCEKNTEDFMSIGISKTSISNSTNVTAQSGEEVEPTITEKSGFDIQIVPIPYRVNNQDTENVCSMYDGNNRLSFNSSSSDNSDILIEQFRDEIKPSSVNYESLKNISTQENKSSPENSTKNCYSKKESLVLKSLQSNSSNNISETEISTEILEDPVTKDNAITQQKATNATDFASERTISNDCDHPHLEVDVASIITTISKLPTRNPVDAFSEQALSGNENFENTNTTTGPLNVELPVQFIDSKPSVLSVDVPSFLPTNVTTLSNWNTGPSTSIIIIPINTGVGQMQSQKIETTASNPIILYIPQASHTPANNQYMSPILDKTMFSNELNGLISHMSPIVNDHPIQTTLNNKTVSPNDNPNIGSTVYNCNENLPFIQTNQPLNNKSTEIISYDSLSYEEQSSLIEELTRHYICAHDDNITFPPTLKSDLPIYNFPVSDLTFLKNEPLNNVLINELPITAREANVAHFVGGTPTVNHTEYLAVPKAPKGISYETGSHGSHMNSMLSISASTDSHIDSMIVPNPPIHSKMDTPDTHIDLMSTEPIPIENYMKNLTPVETATNSYVSPLTFDYNQHDFIETMVRKFLTDSYNLTNTMTSKNSPMATLTESKGENISHMENLLVPKSPSVSQMGFLTDPKDTEEIASKMSPHYRKMDSMTTVKTLTDRHTDSLTISKPPARISSRMNPPNSHMDPGTTLKSLTDSFTHSLTVPKSSEEIFSTMDPPDDHVNSKMMTRAPTHRRTDSMSVPKTRSDSYMNILMRSKTATDSYVDPLTIPVSLRVTPKEVLKVPDTPNDNNMDVLIAPKDQTNNDTETLGVRKTSTDSSTLTIPNTSYDNQTGTLTEVKGVSDSHIETLIPPKAPSHSRVESLTIPKPETVINKDTLVQETPTDSRMNFLTGSTTQSNSFMNTLSPSNMDSNVDTFTIPKSPSIIQMETLTVSKTPTDNHMDVLTVLNDPTDNDIETLGIKKPAAASDMLSIPKTLNDSHIGTLPEPKGSNVNRLETLIDPKARTDLHMESLIVPKSPSDQHTGTVTDIKPRTPSYVDSLTVPEVDTHMDSPIVSNTSTNSHVESSIIAKTLVDSHVDTLTFSKTSINSHRDFLAVLKAPDNIMNNLTNPNIPTDCFKNTLTITDMPKTNSSTDALVENQMKKGPETVNLSIHDTRPSIPEFPIHETHSLIPVTQLFNSNFSYENDHSKLIVFSDGSNTTHSEAYLQKTGTQLDNSPLHTEVTHPMNDHINNMSILMDNTKLTGDKVLPMSDILTKTHLNTSLQSHKENEYVNATKNDSLVATCNFELPSFSGTLINSSLEDLPTETSDGSYHVNVSSLPITENKSSDYINVLSTSTLSQGFETTPITDNLVMSIVPASKVPSPNQVLQTHNSSLLKKEANINTSVSNQYKDELHYPKDEILNLINFAAVDMNLTVAGDKKMEGHLSETTDENNDDNIDTVENEELSLNISTESKLLPKYENEFVDSKQAFCPNIESDLFVNQLPHVPQETGLPNYLEENNDPQEIPLQGIIIQDNNKYDSIEIQEKNTFSKYLPFDVSQSVQIDNLNQHNNFSEIPVINNSNTRLLPISKINKEIDKQGEHTTLNVNASIQSQTTDEINVTSSFNNISENFSLHNENKKALSTIQLKLIKSLLENILPNIEKINLSTRHQKSESLDLLDETALILLEAIENRTLSKELDSHISHLSNQDLSEPRGSLRSDYEDVIIKKGKNISLENKTANKISANYPTNDISHFKYDVNNTPLPNESKKSLTTFELKIIKALLENILPQIPQILKGSLRRESKEKEDEPKKATEFLIFKDEDKDIEIANINNVVESISDPLDLKNVDGESEVNISLPNKPADEILTTDKHKEDYVLKNKNKALTTYKLKIIKAILEHLLPKIMNGSLRLNKIVADTPLQTAKPTHDSPKKVESYIMDSPASRNNPENEDLLLETGKEHQQNILIVDNISKENDAVSEISAIDIPIEDLSLALDDMDAYFYDLDEVDNRSEYLHDSHELLESNEDETIYKNVFDYLPFAKEVKEDIRIIKDLLEYLLMDITNGGLRLDKGKKRKKRH